MRGGLGALGDVAAGLRELAVDGLANVERTLNEDRIRLAVTGLSRAGKTVFITSLIQNLLALGQGRNTLPRITARLSENGVSRLRSIEVMPADAGVLPFFDYPSKLRNLAASAPSWPPRTEDVAHISLALEINRQSTLGQKLGARRIRLDILDYHGEWLLDLPMLAQSYADWSAQTLGLLRTPPRLDCSAAFLAFTEDRVSWMRRARSSRSLRGQRLLPTRWPHRETSRPDPPRRCGAHAAGSGARWPRSRRRGLGAGGRGHLEAARRDGLMGRDGALRPSGQLAHAFVMPLFVLSPGLGFMAVIAVALGGAMLCYAGLLEIRAYRSLSTVEHLRAGLTAPTATLDAARGQALLWLRQVALVFPEREAAEGMLRGAATVAEVRGILRSQIADRLREAAGAIGRRAAVEGATLANLCPHPAWEGVIAGVRGLMVIRSVGALYGLRPGLSVTLMLLRRVAWTAAGTAGLDLMSQGLVDHVLSATPVLKHVAAALPSTGIIAVRLLRLASMTAESCSPV